MTVFHRISRLRSLAMPFLASAAMLVLISRVTGQIHKVDPANYRACGVNSLYVTCRMMGVDVTYSALEGLVGPDEDGECSLKELTDAAHAVELYPVVVKLSPEELKGVPAPVILHTKSVRGLSEGDHFLVYLGSTERGAVVLDPPQPPKEISAAVFRDVFSGVVFSPCTSKESAEQLLSDLGAIRARNSYATAWWVAGSLATVSVVVACYRALRLRARALLMLWPILVVVSMSGCTREVKQPELTIEKQKLDAGVVGLDGMDYAVALENRGAGELRIHNVSTTCACTIADVPAVVGAGETGNLVIRLPGSVRGPNASRLLIESNDPNSPHEVIFSWFGESAPRLDPPAILLDDVRPGERISRRFKITHAAGDPKYELTLKRMKVSLPNFTLQHLGPVQSRTITSDPSPNHVAVLGANEFILRGVAPNQTGMLVGQCDISVAQGKTEHHLLLKVQIDVSGPLSVSGSLLFSEASVEELRHKSQTVILRAMTPTESVNVIESPSFVRTAVSRMHTGPRHSTFRLKVEMTDIPELESSSGEYGLKVKSDRSSPVVIPMRVLVRE